jgi:hypothetical protein
VLACFNSVEKGVRRSVSTSLVTKKGVRPYTRRCKKGISWNETVGLLGCNRGKTKEEKGYAVEGLWENTSRLFGEKKELYCSKF